MKTEEAVTRIRDVLRRQHKALSTEETYVFWLRRFMSALRVMPATLTSEKKLERFLTELARRHNVSASSQNQALNAILFFYREVMEQTLGKLLVAPFLRHFRIRCLQTELVRLAANAGV